MTVKEVDYLLLGGGAASAAAATTLRLEGAVGSILMLSAEDSPPFYRPALSKLFLQGRSSAEQILLHPEDFYREKNIELALGLEASAVDSFQRLVTTARGEQLRYRNLLIATGSRPKRLVLPGVDLPGVHHVRNQNDCVSLRREIESGAKRAVVLGASFQGMEFAMSLLDLGLEVTLIEQRDILLPHLEAPGISDYFRRLAEVRGAVVALSDTIAAINGCSRIRGVRTASGFKFACDLLIVSIGVQPATEFLAGSGVALDAEGLVIVDDQLGTSAPNVFAAGDVTCFYDPVFARRRHIEHWDNALKQGRLAARNMLGRRMRYDEVSYFFCDIGDISFTMLGAPEETDEQMARGALADRSFALFYLKDSILRALFSIGRPIGETRAAEGLIRYRVNLREMKSGLPNPDFSLERLPAQSVLVLQGGGAMGAFEVGVVKALEEEGIFPDIVAGISIGALNGAIIASNPRSATRALQSFWSQISVTSPALLGEVAARAVASAQILAFGVPNFFQPRWLPSVSEPMTPPGSWTSFYDTAPMKELIARYVDFAALKSSPVRLLVGAVDVESGKLEVFDSYVDTLTPGHVLASGSLPPGFPWTEIDGKAYWDGGVVSNSPLDMVIERCGPDAKQIFIIDLYASQRSRPTNILEVMARRDEIVYSERIRSDLRLRELTGAYRALVKGILDLVDADLQAKIRQRPLFMELMGDDAATTITRFIRRGPKEEPPSRDYDFSDIAIRSNHEQGYALAKDELAKRRKRGEQNQ